MRKFLGWLAFLVLTGGALPAVRGADAPMAEIVVAMRYFQQTGESHSHLYLYREDGKLLRQLTNENVGQDREPMFSPDGEVIVFARRDDKGGGTNYYSIEPKGGNLHMIAATPQWYVDTKDVAGLGHIARQPVAGGGGDSTLVRTASFATAAGKVMVAIEPAPGEDPEGAEKWNVSLQGDEGGKKTKAGELTGFAAAFLSRQEDDPSKGLLEEGPLSVVFCYLHLNSTDGDTVAALDLNAKKIVPLSPNWAEPIPLPGQSAFLTWTDNRYVPFGDGKRTANCSYIEHWDAKLQKVRYAKDKAAGDCYGASMYRPGKTPAMMVLRPAKE